jgi:TetR/AcrR family fatty acid metabolism transcriptional regulator
MPSTSKTRPASTGPRAERQREILSAAVRAFSKHGYHHCTVSRIAREAGVADGTIYLYFRGKEDLLVSSFQHVLAEMLVDMARRTSAASDAADKLRLATLLQLEFTENNPDLARFLQSQLRQPEESLRELIATPLADYTRSIEAIIEEGKLSGVFRSDVPTEALRRIYFGALNETVSAWLTRSRGFALIAAATPLLDVLLNGMRSH